MHAMQQDCQVLVVGAGPTGLVLAAELLARGISTRVIDQGDGVALQARAIGIHARTLEVLDTMGLADRFTECGQVVRQLRFYSRARCLTSLEFARCGSRFGYVLDLPQDQTERLLRARIAELGGAVEQRAELTRLAISEDAVIATVSDPAGQPRTITAGYVVGCDGAHSRVRRELGLTFRGQPYPQDWLLADVLLGGDLPDGDLREDAIHAFFRPVTLSDPTWLASFRCHRRSASACRRGRVLLAGDAVHIHSPAGGQGLNTGILDAHNLGWKLALVASGRAPDALLDTYGAERRPVAEEVLRLTHALVHYGTISHPVKRRIRDVVVPVLGRSAVIQRRAARRISQVYVSYPYAGPRMPDISVRADGLARPLHQVLRDGRPVLVVPEASSLTALDGLAPYRDDLVVVTVPGTGPVVLVRPDGHVAARGRPGRELHSGQADRGRVERGDRGPVWRPGRPQQTVQDAERDDHYHRGQQRPQCARLGAQLGPLGLHHPGLGHPQR